jgi:hypothetical protein
MMPKIIEVTDSGDQKFYLNITNCISISRDTFNSETKILFPGIVFGVKETPEEIIGMINPH